MPRRWTLAVFVLLVVSVVVGQIYRRPLLNLLGVSENVTSVTPPPCDLNQSSCLLSIITPVASEAPWRFGISPQPIPVSQPLSLTLTPPAQTLPGNRPTSVWVDLTGDSMDMGLIRVALMPMPDGRWEGTGSIPVCVSGQMRWRARLHMQLDQTQLQADWTFEAPTAAYKHPGQTQ